MTNPRDILNKIKWKNNQKLDNVEIWFIHRGAPNNTKIINGNDVQKIGRSFIHTHTSMIPFHRIFKITHNNKIVFKRDRNTENTS